MLFILPLHIAAPQPTFRSDSVSVYYGSNVTLPCTINIANPSPSYYWECISTRGLSYWEANETLSDGSLYLKNVQSSGIYQCNAHNDYGSSVQIIELCK